MTKPFLLLQTRPEDEASDNEYQAFLELCKLESTQLERRRLESGANTPTDLSSFSGIIIGGGPFNTSDQVKNDLQQHVEAKLTKLLERVIEQDFPLLGACYGIGLLAVHQGGVVSRRFGEEVGPVTINLTAAGQTEPLLAGLPAQFEAFVGHKEACEVTPPGATLLASSASCPTQMYRIGKNVFAAQFHPELDSDGLALRIRVYKNAGYFPPEEAEPLIARGYQANVTHPPLILQNFVARYQTA